MRKNKTESTREIKLQLNAKITILKNCDVEEVAKLALEDHSIKLAIAQLSSLEMPQKEPKVKNKHKREIGI